LQHALRTRASCANRQQTLCADACFILPSLLCLTFLSVCCKVACSTFCSFSQRHLSLLPPAGSLLTTSLGWQHGTGGRAGRLECTFTCTPTALATPPVARVELDGAEDGCSFSALYASQRGAGEGAAWRPAPATHFLPSTLHCLSVSIPSSAEHQYRYQLTVRLVKGGVPEIMVANSSTWRDLRGDGVREEVVS